MINPYQQQCLFINCCNQTPPSEELISPNGIRISSNKISLKRVHSTPSNQLISRQALSPPISKQKHTSKELTNITPSTVFLSPLISPKSIHQNSSPRVVFSWRTNYLQKTTRKFNEALFPSIIEIEMRQTRQMHSGTKFRSDAKEKRMESKPVVAVNVIKNNEQKQTLAKNIQNINDIHKDSKRQYSKEDSGHKKLQDYKSSLISIKSQEQSRLGQKKQALIQQSMIMVDYFHPSKQQFNQIQMYLNRSKKIN